LYKPLNPDAEPNEDVLTPEENDEAWLEQAESEAEIATDWEREEEEGA